MADAPAPAASKGFDLTQKVGPLPLWAWLGAGIVIWWYLQRKQAASASAPNQQTDPAGNIGAIDPASGYVYGTPEDLAALAANNAGSSSTGTSAGTNATTGAQKYADNNTWGIAAVNYLAGLGIDAVTANQAVQNYLSSQPLTSAEQGDVNLAIQALGAPPSLPGPVTTSPPPVTTPPSGGGNAGGSVLINIHDGTGHWQAAQFPNAAAVTTFLNSLGAHLSGTGVLFGPDVGQVWPTEPSPAAISNALAAAGGTLAGPPGQSGAGIVKYQGGTPTGAVSW